MFLLRCISVIPLNQKSRSWFETGFLAKQLYQFTSKKTPTTSDDYFVPIFWLLLLLRSFLYLLELINLDQNALSIILLCPFFPYFLLQVFAKDKKPQLFRESCGLAQYLLFCKYITLLALEIVTSLAQRTSNNYFILCLLFKTIQSLDQ